MRALVRTTAVLVCAAALLAALPAQAAPAHRSHATSVSAAAPLLSSVLADLAHFFTARPGQPAGGGHKTLPKGGSPGQGGSCLDPNGTSGGCGTTLLVFGL